SSPRDAAITSPPRHCSRTVRRGTVTFVTMTIGVRLHELEDGKQAAVESTLRGLAALGHAPRIQTIVGNRVVRATPDGVVQWLAAVEAAPIFDAIDKAGHYVSVPGWVDKIGFQMLASLGLPWPSEGAWQRQYEERLRSGWKLVLP